MVDGGDVVVQQVLVGLVEIDALVDDGLVVLVGGRALVVEGARALDVAALDLQRIEAAIGVGIEPFADGVARESRLRAVRRPAASVRVDPARQVVGEHHIGHIRRDGEFGRLVEGHDSGHAARDAADGRVVALAAGRLIGEARLVDHSVLGSQRGFLGAAGRLAWIISVGAALGLGDDLLVPPGVSVRAIAHGHQPAGHT